MSRDLKLNNFCRCCLSMDTNTLIEMKDQSGEISFFDIFLECSSVGDKSIIPDVDDVPKICEVCVELLKSTFYFRLLCRTADKALQDWYGAKKPTKKATVPPPAFPPVNLACLDHLSIPSKPETTTTTASPEIIHISDDEVEVFRKPEPVKDRIMTNPSLSLIKFNNTSSKRVNLMPSLDPINLDVPQMTPQFNNMTLDDGQTIELRLQKLAEKPKVGYYSKEITHQCPYCFKNYEDTGELIGHISETH